MKNKNSTLAIFFLLVFQIPTLGQKDTLKPGLIPIEKGPILKPGLIPRDVIYVKWNARGRSDGTSWTNAYRNLQNALEAATAGKTIWVAAGTYKPTSTLDRRISFRMKNGVSMYGGFSGSETTLGARNIKLNPVILDGNIGNLRDTIDDSYNIVYVEAVDSFTVLDGFVIQNANADMTTSQIMLGSAGGGIYIDGSPGGTNVVIKNCLIRRNKANRGAGVVITGLGLVRRGGGGNPKFINCRFEVNQAKAKGGAVYIDSYYFNFNPSFTDCRFDGNLAFDAGGAVSQYVVNGSSSPKFKSCHFYFNRANYGVAISIEHMPRDIELTTDPVLYAPSLENCVFKNNGMESLNNSGTISSTIHAYSVLKVLNCLFGYQEYYATDRFGLRGGAFYNLVSGGGDFRLEVTNSIFNKLNCVGDGGVIYNLIDRGSRAESQFINCLFARNKGCRGGVVAAFNLDTASTNTTNFYNCIFYNNYFGTRHPTLPCGFGQDFYLDDTRSRAYMYNCLTNKADCEIVKNGRGSLECTGVIFNTDPLFRNIEGEDFRLMPGSSAIDAGLNEHVRVLFDYSGAPRIRGKRVDIGPFER